MKKGHRDAPVSHRAGRIVRRDFDESLFRLLVDEGVQQRDGALELLAGLVAAGDRKVDLAELLWHLGAVPVRIVGEAPPAGRTRGDDGETDDNPDEAVRWFHGNLLRESTSRRRFSDSLGRLCHSPPAHGSVLMKSWRHLAPAAWGKCTARVTRVSSARSPSRCCRSGWPRTRRRWRDSGARPGRWRRSRTRTYSPSTTSVCRAIRPTRSPRNSKRRPCGNGSGVLPFQCARRSITRCRSRAGLPRRPTK